MGHANQATASPSPDYTSLVKAIAHHRDLLRERKNLNDALNKASARAQEARRVVSRHEDAKDDAMAADIQAMVDGKDHPISASPDRSAREFARRKLGVAETAMGELREKIAQVDNSLAYSESAIVDARGRFLSSSDAIKKLLDERAALHVKLCDMDDALCAVWKANGLPQFETWHRSDNNTSLGTLALQWQDYIDALLGDADASPPQVDVVG